MVEVKGFNQVFIQSGEDNNWNMIQFRIVFNFM